MVVEELARQSDWVEDLLPRLPRPICVVGNGTSRARWGRVIDSYATVIRMNNFRLAGFEDWVGHRTDLRAVTGWYDVENRNAHVELTPFTHWCRESGNLHAYRARNARDVLTPRIDVHPLIPEVPTPSTGLALAQLFELLGVPVDLFGFDSFRTGHYWDPPSTPPGQDHSPVERQALLRMRHVQVHGELHPYRDVYDYCHATHPAYGENLGLQAVRTLGIPLAHQSILEFGAGNGDLARFLESRGCRTTAVEASRVAFERIRCAEKIHGTAYTLADLRGDFDTFVSFDVLEHLVENDVRIVLNNAARLCDQLLVSVSTRPSGLLGPAGENLHVTVRPAGWWIEQISARFEGLRIAAGLDPAEWVITGRSRLRGRPRQPLEFGAPLRERFVRRGYRSRDLPAQPAAATPDLEAPPFAGHALVARLADALDCSHVICVGPREPDRLVRWLPGLSVIGVGPGAPDPAGEAAGVAFLARNLEAPASLEVDPEILRRSVVVCAGALERLRDPSGVLELVRALLQDAAAGIVSAVDRDVARGGEDLGPPADPCHVREWSRAELCDLLRFAGLNVLHSRRASHGEAASVVVVGPPSPGMPGDLPSRSARLASFVRELGAAGPR